jgi:hypothetical protein
MLARGKVVCICFAVVGCTQPGPTLPDAQVPRDGVTIRFDAARPRCTDPLDGGLADGGVLETTDGFQAEGSGPLVAMDEQGNGIVVWYVRSGGFPDTGRAMARRYTAGVGWSDIEMVMQGGYPTSVALQNETALIALTGMKGVDTGHDTAVIYAALYRAGGWSVLPVGVTSTGWWQEPYTPPPVAVLGQNAGLVAWNGVDEHNGLTAATMVDGAWQPVQTFGGIGDDPTASVLPSGGLAVGWRDCRTEGTSWSCDLLVSSWDRAAGWLPTAALVQSQSAGKPRLAACNGGRPHMIWYGTVGSVHAELLPSGQWSSADIVVAPDQQSYMTDRRLVTDRASNALTAWTSQPSASCEMTAVARYFVDGAGWQDTAQISSSQSGNHAHVADLAMSPNGDAWALWRSGTCDLPDQEIWARRFAPATGWGDLISLDSTYSCSVEGGSLAMGGNRTLAAWTRTSTAGIVVRWLE